MRLTRFEQEAITFLVKGHKDAEAIKEKLLPCLIQHYEFTGAGYFLQLRCESWNLETKTIHKPVVIGKSHTIEVGFLLFTDGQTLTLECHSWGEDNLPQHIREIDLTLIVEDN